MSNYTSPIQETSYLSVPGVAHYRMIMRKMFIENEHMHSRLYKEEIMKLVKEDSDFENYTMEDLKQDLEQLVVWNNLIAIQDPGIVHTIAEYKNKQYRYSMSEKAVEIERLTIRLENINIESANLSVNYFYRIDEALKNAENVFNQSSQEINEWWHLLQEDFQRLNQNYKGYLMDFYNSDTRALLQSVEFILHKDRFIQYLNNFIKQMQFQSRKIRARIISIGTIFNEDFIDKIVQSELEIPRIGKKEQSKEVLRNNICSKWISLERWFISIDGQKPECDRILEITNEIIRSLIDNANMIVQMNNYGVSRKDDYKHFIEMFLHCDTLNDAHCLSAHIFGIQKLQHFKVENILDTENTKVSSYTKDENLVKLESHSRTYKEKKQKEGILDQSMMKMIARIEYEDKIKKNEELLNIYIKNNKLVISDIKETIPSELRKSILTWISNANMNTSKIGSTEFGKKFKLVKDEGTCTLHCVDGDITMPKYTLEFEYEDD